MEIREVLSFYHLRVKYVTLQELFANNTRSLIRDSKKITKKSRVIKFELSCTVTRLPCTQQQDTFLHHTIAVHIN